MKELAPGEKSQAFKHEILMILGKKLKIFPRLPKNVKVVTLDQRDLNNEDLMDFLAHTPPAKSLLLMIFYFHDDRNMTLTELKEFLEKIINSELIGKAAEFFRGSHISTAFTIFRNSIVLLNSGIFYDGDEFEKINIKEVIRDKDTIHTISCFLLSSDIEKAVVLGLLLKKFIDYRIEHKDEIHILFYIREIHSFYNREVPIFYQPLKRAINFILTEGRDNLITLAANTQKPTRQLPPSIYTHFSKIFCHRLPYNDLVSLQNFASIPINIINKMQRVGKGQGIYISSGEFRYLMEIPPTRHMKKEEGFNVINYLSDKFGVNDYSNFNFGDQSINENSDQSEPPLISSNRNRAVKKEFLEEEKEQVKVGDWG